MTEARQSLCLGERGGGGTCCGVHVRMTRELLREGGCVVHERPSEELPRSATIKRIPSLDGLRALSISLVVCLHSLQAFSLTHPVSRYWYAVFNGSDGVFIFFEISGFLITTLLLNEHRKRGSISLRGFYLRRAFRILPPLYLYIGVAVLLGLAGKLALNLQSVLSAMFFYHNVYAPGEMWSIEHLWSISVEEQFYLVWPFVLVYFLRRGGERGRRAAAWFPIAVLLISPVLRVVLAGSGNARLHAAGVTLFRFDFIMFGCLVALLQGTTRFEAWYRRATRLWWIAPGVMVVCSILSTRFENRFDFTVGYTINGAAVAVFLLWCTRNEGSAVGRVLNAGPVAWVGVLSYSIYLWQTVWLHSGNEQVFAWAPRLGKFPLNWVGILACAAASYYFVEQPSLTMRAELIRRWHVYRQRSLTGPSGAERS